MTAQEIYIRVQNDLNSSGANRNRRFLPEQIELAVQSEQLEYIQNAFPEEPGISFKPEQRYLDAVQGLTEIKDNTASKGLVVLPDDVLRILELDPLQSMRAVVGLENCNMQMVSRSHKLTLRRINPSFNSVVKNTAFYRDNDQEVTYRVLGNKLVFNTDGPVRIIETRTTYIRMPKKFSIAHDQTLELHPGFHEEICDRVVQRLRERVGDPKFQTGQTRRNNTL